MREEGGGGGGGEEGILMRSCPWRRLEEGVVGLWEI